MSTIEQAREAKRALARKLVDLPELNGIGIAREGCSYVLKVNLSSQSSRAIPKNIGKVSVRIEVAGDIAPQK